MSPGPISDVLLLIGAYRNVKGANDRMVKWKQTLITHTFCSKDNTISGTPKEAQAAVMGAFSIVSYLSFGSTEQLILLILQKQTSFNMGERQQYLYIIAVKPLTLSSL